MKVSLLLRPASPKAAFKLPIIGIFLPVNGLHSPQKKFDSAVISRLMNPIAIENLMPGLIKQLARHTEYSSDSGQAKQAYGEICGTATRLLKEGPERIKWALYGRFTAAKNIEEVRSPVKVASGNVINLSFISHPKLPEQLTPSEQIAWETYQFTRSDALCALERLLALFHDLPDVRYIPDRGIQELKEKVWNIQYQIALAVLPDITDADAKTLFGQLSSAKEVRELANSLTP